MRFSRGGIIKHSKVKKSDSGFRFISKVRFFFFKFYSITFMEVEILMQNFSLLLLFV